MKNEMNEQDNRKDTGFLLKQRAFLKLYMITMTEENRLYGMQLRDTLREEFKHLGYAPTHAEIYRALHSLMDDGILKQIKVKKEGTKLQEVVLYQFEDYEAAKKYKRRLKAEIDRCIQLLTKAVRDNFK
ncbi:MULTISPECIES: Replication termination protein [Bacillus]|uniref:Replication termination protein n=1 Tax=Bacillus TaxID=1386 RepID=UPI002236E81B|nr:hypothetical protein [Bacillus subtilis]